MIEMIFDSVSGTDSGGRGRAFVIIASLMFVSQLSLPLCGQTGWQPCGTGTCITSGNVGVGTTSPAGKLHVSDGTTLATVFANQVFSTDITLSVNNAVRAVRLLSASDTATARISNTFIRSRGSLDAPTPVAADDYIGDVLFAGYDGSQFNFSAGLFAYADGAPTSGSQTPIKLSLVTGTNGSNRTARLTVLSDGNVGIGTIVPQHKLSVNGTIGTKEVIVTNTGWADYVFKPDYRLISLDELAAHIQEHGRLPEIPSEAEVKEKGIGLAEMQVKLLAKIEELTLHMIELNERNKALEEKVAMLEEISRR